MINCGVYKITDVETGDFYIGSSKEIRVRRNQHFSDLRCGRHKNDHLQRLHNNGRKLTFEIYIATRPEDRLFYEQICLDKLNPKLNKTFDALAPMEGKTHSEEYREIQRQKALSPESPLKRPDVIARISGDNHYMRRPGYDKSTHPSKNPEIVAKRTAKIFSSSERRAEYAARMAEIAKRPEVRAIVSAAMSGENHHQAKLSLEKAIEIILTPKSYDEIIKEYGIQRSQVCRIKLGKSWMCARKIIEQILNSNDSDETLSIEHTISVDLVNAIRQNGMKE